MCFSLAACGGDAAIYISHKPVIARDEAAAGDFNRAEL